MRKAKEHGLAGCILSNHVSWLSESGVNSSLIPSGWSSTGSVRCQPSDTQTDPADHYLRARTGFDSLRSIHAEDPSLAKQIELYIDGGVRRGTDVLQALAFGAKGVGLGRTFLWSQAAYGEKGVIRAIRSEPCLPHSSDQESACMLVG